MKKLVALFVAVAFAMSLAAVAIAADEKAAPAPAKKEAAPMKKEGGEPKEAAKKARPKVVTGIIDAIDAAKGTLTVMGRKGPVSLKAGEKVKLDEFKQGDKVLVTYTGDTATKVVKAKTVKREPKKEGGAPKEAPKQEAAPAK